MTATLAQPAPAAKADGWVLDPGIPGDGINRLAGSGVLKTFLPDTPHAQVQETGMRDGIPEFRLVARGAAGEHYLLSSEVALEAGAFTLSMEAIPLQGGVLRAWLVDAAGTGVYGDFDIATRFSEVGTNRSEGITDMRIGMEPVDAQWTRIWTGATISAGKYRLMFHIGSGKAGRLGYAPNGEAIAIRGLQLEKGQRPSPYRPPQP